MLRQRLSQKLTQKLSPQQIQLMKLLQVPTASLEQRVKEELEANPALDEGENEEEDLITQVTSAEDEKTEEQQVGDELDLSDYFTDDDYPDYRTRGDSYSQDEEEKSVPVAVQESFHENLRRQLGMVTIDDRRRELAKQLIGSLDDDGYLRRELDAVVDDLMFSQNVSTTVEELEELLELIQGFEPAGIGARDLRECLLIQLRRKEGSPSITAAIRVQIGRAHV